MSLQLKLSAITLDCENEISIGFQRVDGYRAPQRPEQTVPQQLHMCFKVKQELDQVEARLLKLGAGRPDHQPHGDKARVLTDPVGHPFCIVKECGWRARQRAGVMTFPREGLQASSSRGSAIGGPPRSVRRVAPRAGVEC
ncbi:VOC family protein [Streptomyces griseorubiginosus]|uniref:VOC family protein n=1 Tax=Streptomyces griseorubiginosus TaxID=67304 RepID=UPI003653895B